MSTTATAHLWDADHPYYCSESNYFSNEARGEYGSWDQFLAEEGDGDMDLNLVFRWDWHGPDAEGMANTLELFFMGQRKGLFRPVVVHNALPEREVEIRAWLTERWLHMQRLWAPIAEDSPSSPAA